MPLTLCHADTTRQFGHEYFTRNIYTSILTIRPTSPEYADDTTNYLLLCLEFNQPREQLQTYLWSPYVIGQTIIFSCCFFFLLSFFPRLISAVGDWMFTILSHMVWP